MSSPDSGSPFCGSPHWAGASSGQDVPQHPLQYTEPQQQLYFEPGASYHGQVRDQSSSSPPSGDPPPFLTDGVKTDDAGSSGRQGSHPFCGPGWSGFNDIDYSFEVDFLGNASPEGYDNTRRGEWYQGPGGNVRPQYHPGFGGSSPPEDAPQPSNPPIPSIPTINSSPRPWSQMNMRTGEPSDMAIRQSGPGYDRHLRTNAYSPSHDDARLSVPSAGGSSPDSSRREMSPSVPNPLLCPVCRCEFTGLYRKGNLARHYKCKHSSENPSEFLCPECVRTFRRSDALLKHLRKHHAHLVAGKIVYRKQR